MYEGISRIWFESRHSLSIPPSVAPPEKCLFAADLVFRSERLYEPGGEVIDYEGVERFRRWVRDTLEDKNIYASELGEEPTLANIAEWMYRSWKDSIPRLSGVRVSCGLNSALYMGEG